MKRKAFLRARTTEDTNLRRSQILDAARHVFLDRGIEKATLDHIAQEAGLSRSLVYLYFTDKLGVLSALSAQSAQKIFEQMLAKSAKASTGIGTIEALCEAFFTFFIDDYSDYAFFEHQLIARSHNSNRDPSKLPFSRVEENIFSLICNAVHQGIYDCTLSSEKSDNPIYIASFIYGSVTGVAMIQSALFSTHRATKEEVEAALSEAQRNVIHRVSHFGAVGHLDRAVQ